MYLLLGASQTRNLKQNKRLQRYCIIKCNGFLLYPLFRNIFTNHKHWIGIATLNQIKPLLEFT